MAKIDQKKKIKKVNIIKERIIERLIKERRNRTRITLERRMEKIICKRKKSEVMTNGSCTEVSDRK